MGAQIVTKRQRLTITDIGSQGDGVALQNGHAVFVPGAAPGDVVEADLDGAHAIGTSVVSRGENFQEPPCPHFGTCGGCVAQHLTPKRYHAWKLASLEGALSATGISVPIETLLTCGPRTRRRATFTVANRGDGTVEIGFMARGTRSFVPISTCHVITDAMEALWPTLKRLGETFVPPGSRGQISVLETGSGFDVAIRSAHPVNDDIRRGLARIVQGTAIARLTLNGEIILKTRDPILSFGGVAVVPPPGGFTQAATDAEEAMAAIVAEFIGKSKSVLDLFAGSGTFALRLARRNDVHAVESDPAALAALEQGWKAHAGDLQLRKVTTMRRDLYMNPIPTRDLADYRAIVLDPPRAGAKEQCAHIAASGVPKVASVSCNAETFARDLAILRDGGYAIERVFMVDQFLWSAHVEAIALLTKPLAKPKRGLG